MATNSSIEWTETTWNPVTGCDKVSSGCKHCYAERMAKRLKAMGQPRYRNGFELTLQPDTLSLPMSWKKPKLIFVNSMSDLFHEGIPDQYIEDVFRVMNKTDHHIYQVLTKRSERLLNISQKLNWTPNIWMGVSVENADAAYRIDHLRKIGAVVKFLSLEPLIGPLTDVPLEGVDWAIVGGESGPGARPMLQEWVIEIRDECLGKDIPFFFKQWGGVQKKKFGRVLDGKTWDQYPKQHAEHQAALSA